MRREATVVTSASDARRLGRYVLVGELGEGGMGRVYLARASGHAGFEKLVALKVMSPDLVRRHPDMAHMFVDEARIGALLRHPNVCAVLDYGEAQGVRFLVLEYLEGQSLLAIQRRLQDRPQVRAVPVFPIVAARIVAEACEGLHGAHTAVDPAGQPMHVVHRDVSPENLFVTYDGAVKVMDFGIARARHRTHETTDGSFKGKIGYASPEALNDQPLDARSDVWSAGIVLWELLVGKPLFVRKTEAATVGAVLKAPIPAPSELRPELRGQLDGIVMKALSRNPLRRFATARDMAQALNQYAASRGQHVGTAELAGFLAEIFPEERAADREVGNFARGIASAAGDASPLGPVDLSRSLIASEVRPSARAGVAPEPLPELHDAPTRITPLGPSSKPPPPPILPPSQSGAFPEQPAPREERRSTARRVVGVVLRVAFAAVALALGIGIADYLSRDDDEEPAAPPAQAPQPTADEAPEPEPVPVIARPNVVEEEAVEPEATPPPAPSPTSMGRRRAARTATRTAPPPAVAAAGETGQVNVFARGSWADIYEDGQLIGRTPARLQLPAGRHVLTLRPPEGAEVQRTVSVAPGETTHVRVDF